MSAAQRFKLALREDRNAGRVERTSKRCWIVAACNSCDLGRRESHDVSSRIVAKNDIEIVEVASGCSDNDDAAPPRRRTLTLRERRGRQGTCAREKHGMRWF
jgi:hypothetical protein